ncbi:LysM peptidoglycan-binding domain-containing protein [Saccharopolyspora sp. NPDC003752]
MPVILTITGRLVTIPDLPWPKLDTSYWAPPIRDQLTVWAEHTWHTLRLDLRADGALLLVILTTGWSTWSCLMWWTLSDLILLVRYGTRALRERLPSSGPRGWIAAVLASTVISLSGPSASAAPAADRAAVTAPHHPSSGVLPAPSSDTTTLGSGGYADPTPPPEPSTPTHIDDSHRPDCPRYRVARGDTLWDLAQRHLANPQRWREIRDLNADRIGDSRHLQPGWILLLPPDATQVPTPPAIPEDAQWVTAEPGDTLTTIAEHHLGNADRWDEIFRLNAHHPQPDGRVLRDPDLIFPGWSLALPLAEHSAHAPVAHPATPLPVEPTASPEPLPAPDHAEPEASPGLAEDPSGSNSDAADRERGPVVLPSGAVVSLSLAAAVATVLTLARRRRRHHRRPGSAPQASAARPRTAAEPVRLLDHAARHHAPDETAASACGEEFAPRRAWPPPAPVLIAHTDTGEQHLGLASVAGLGLTGPGAPAAARAILTAVVAGDTLHPGQIHLVGPDILTTLTHDPDQPTDTDTTAATVLGEVAGVTATDNEHDALAGLEAELARRTRLLDDHDLHPDRAEDPETATDIAARTAARFHAYQDQDPAEAVPTLLVCARPTPATRARWAAVCELGRSLGIHALQLTNAWTPTLDIADDGTINHTHGPGIALPQGARLDTLHTSDATEIWRVIAAAHDTTPTDAGPDTESETGTPVPGASCDADDRGTHQRDDEPARGSEAGHGAVVRVRLLGGIRVEAAGGEVSGLRSLAREILAYLAAHPAGARSDTLEEDILSHVPPGNRRAQLHTAISHARAALRKATGLPDQRFITSTTGVYRLDDTLITLDVRELADALQQARNTTDNSIRLHALNTVAELCRAGPPLEGAHYAWAEPVAEMWRSQALDALVSLATTTEHDNPERALDILQLATTWDPYTEQLYQHIMRIQTTSGRPEAAAATFRALRARLADIDCEPDPTTTKILTPQP